MNHLETNQAIKAHYLSKGKTEQQRAVVNQNPALFNRVWRNMLRMSDDTTPPPSEYLENKLYKKFKSAIMNST